MSGAGGGGGGAGSGGDAGTDTATDTGTDEGLESTPPSTFNVLDYGAHGNGLNDDTQAIQAALDAAAAAAGGTVYLPAGTYLVSPGNGIPLAVASNVTVSGDGAASILKISDGTTDYMSIFGSDHATSATPVHDITFKNFRVDQNPGRAGSYDIRDNGGVNIAEFVISFSNARVVLVDGVQFDPIIGVQTISIAGYVDAITVHACRFRFVRGRSTQLGPSCYAGAAGPCWPYDNTAVYVEGTNQHFYENTCTGDIPDHAFTCMEAHGGPALVEGNQTDGYASGALANTFQPLISGANNIIIRNNTFVNANDAIGVWSLTGRLLQTVVIDGNTITLAQQDHQRPTASGIKFVYGVSGDVSGQFDDISITNNTITFQTGGSYPPFDPLNTVGIGVAPVGNVSNTTVSGNTIRSAPTIGIRIGDAAAGNVTSLTRVTGNQIIDAGIDGAVDAGLRAAIRLESTLTSVQVDGNVISDTGRPACLGSQSIWAQPGGSTWQGDSLHCNLVTSAGGCLLLNVDDSAIDVSGTPNGCP